MSEHRPRPRAFRLDDERVAVDDAPAPPAPTATIRSQTAAIAETGSPEPIDDDRARRRSGAALWRARALAPEAVDARLGRASAGSSRSASACG